MCSRWRQYVKIVLTQRHASPYMIRALPVNGQVGDSYVAVCGVPQQKRDHAVIMARFATECLMALPDIVMNMERFLGPGTGDLNMRFGLHSGPVTAGVLRGDKARFQIFGDAVNTAARLESTGSGGRIHVSEEAAQQLMKSGKTAWLQKREGAVFAKGKGKLHTYWLKLGAGTMVSDASASHVSWSSDSPVGGPQVGEQSAKEHVILQRTRLVEWNTEMLLQILKAIRAKRAKKMETFRTGDAVAEESYLSRTSPLNEVTEVVALPEFDVSKCGHVDEDVQIPLEIRQQLAKLVDKIAGLYNNNPFHNFGKPKHCCCKEFLRSSISRVY